MSLHHGMHHAAYVDNLNAAEAKLAQAQAKGTTRCNIQSFNLAYKDLIL